MYPAPTGTISALLAFLLCFPAPLRGFEGAEVVDFYGYSDCIRLSNETTEAILCPAAGGRILYYALHGTNALYLPEGAEGWVWDGESNSAPMHAGRFDIGPEQVVPKRPTLWQGVWQGEIVGDRQAILRSQVDPHAGVRLERTFALSPKSTELTCTQTIINTSDAPVEYCHWSRTFATGNGICVIPVSEPSRFPNAYVRYDPPGKMLNMAPEDQAVERIGDYLVIRDHPKHPKLGFDSMVGWLAYQTTDGLLFVKRFPTFPDRAYNEVAGLTISVWYPEGNMVELEPIGPRQRLLTGESASFTETWYLLEHPMPEDGQIEPEAIAEQVEALGQDTQ